MYDKSGVVDIVFQSKNKNMKNFALLYYNIENFLFNKRLLEGSNLPKIKNC